MKKVMAISPQEWGQLAVFAHQVAFKENRPTAMNTFDYVLAYANEDEIFAYATIIEMNNQSAYMQHGGAMPNIKGTTSTLRAYHEIMEWLKSKYTSIATRIENKNIPMLKLALHEGLLVHGCDLYKNEVYLHLAWGFDV